MAPSSSEIKHILSSFFEGGGGSALAATRDTLPVLKERCHPDAKFHVVGQDFGLACQDQSLDALMAKYFKGISTALDMSKPMTSEVIRVMGGGEDPYAAVELKSVGTTKKGKPWIHECMIVIRFNDQGELCDAKAYFDTLHLHNHMMDCAK